MAEVTKTKDRWENIIEAKNRGGRAVYRDGRKEMEIYDDRGNMVCVLDIDHIANIVEILDYIKQEWLTRKGLAKDADFKDGLNMEG